MLALFQLSTIQLFLGSESSGDKASALSSSQASTETAFHCVFSYSRAHLLLGGPQVVPKMTVPSLPAVAQDVLF